MSNLKSPKKTDKKCESANNIDSHREAYTILNFNDGMRFLNVSKSCLYKLCHFGKIPYYKPNNKLLYFLKEELQIWVLKNRFPSSDEINQQSINFLTTKKIK